ncbi:copper resistance CopC/CopD family protein [Streptomyces sp. NPDC101117]|uniref:copper resistance CopC/CopD family protein n=1 Tax=Streptomyces sp. NPDC101117 TaxID=3366108 RepID=UPI0037F1CE2D
MRCADGRPGRRGPLRLLLLGPLLVLLLLGGTGSASAHAVLRDSDPGDGAVLKSAPQHLTLTFSESVALLDDSFRVLDPDGRRLRVGEPGNGPDGADTARVTLPAGLEQGTYTVAWRVVSADSHPVSGAFTFSVGKATVSTAAAALATGPTEDPVTKALHTIARYLAYLSVAVLIGTAAFVAVCRPPHVPLHEKLSRASWWALLAATLALLVLRAPYETGEGPLGAFDADAAGRALTGRPGIVLLARLALVLAAGAYLLRMARRRRRYGWTGAALAAGLAATWAAGEHASAGLQVPVAMTSSALHLLATAVWLGGLAALLAALHQAALSAQAVRRFSRVAFASVTVLVVTGVYQSWRGLGGWDALADTTYGRLLAIKLMAVVVLLAAAAVSRRWTALLTTPAVAEPSGGRSEERTVRTKVAAAVGGPSGPPASTPVTASPPQSPSPSQSPSASEPPGPDPSAEGGPDPAHRRALRRSVLTEVAVGAAVLAVTTLLTSTLPGRAEAEAATAAPAVVGASVTDVPFDVGTPGGRGTAQITIDPARVGDNSIEAVVYGPDGGISSVPELRISFTHPGQDIGPLDAGLTDRGGYWGNSFLNLPVAGTWEMKVTVRTSDVDQITETRAVTIH